MKLKSKLILRRLALMLIALGLLGLACQTSTQYRVSKQLKIYKNKEQQYRQQGREAQAKGDTEQARKYFSTAEFWHETYQQAQIRSQESMYITPDDYDTERDLWHERNLDYSNEYRAVKKTKTAADTQSNRSTK